MNLSTLQALVTAGESLTLELKKSTAEKYRACRSLCAMANGQGGQVEGLHATNRWEVLPAQGCGVDSLDGAEMVVTLAPAKGGCWKVL